MQGEGWAYKLEWAAARVGDEPWTILGSEVAVPGRRATVILSQGLGEQIATTLPASSGGRCDVVYPYGTEGLLRIHGRHAWPSRLQRFDVGYGWRTIGRIQMPRTDRCRSVTVDNTLQPSLVHLRGSHLDLFVDLRWNERTLRWEVKPVRRAPVSPR